MPFNDIDILDQNALFFAVNLQNLADFALILTGCDFNLVVFF